eukprot:TRINITY_DN157_c0_g1_i1.p1 TRINITY_DN157_c0_g1~~TRINITY_DN157_c0_g1_i1.p1  ORF type:complete len:367 (+),score=110.22 TRINITY_DN157_c0_g1_i1:124-1224(+)
MAPAVGPSALVVAVTTACAGLFGLRSTPVWNLLPSDPAELLELATTSLGRDVLEAAAAVDAAGAGSVALPPLLPPLISLEAPLASAAEFEGLLAVVGGGRGDDVAAPESEAEESERVLDARTVDSSSFAGWLCAAMAVDMLLVPLLLVLRCRRRSCPSDAAPEDQQGGDSATVPLSPFPWSRQSRQPSQGGSGGESSSGCFRRSNDAGSDSSAAVEGSQELKQQGLQPVHLQMDAATSEAQLQGDAAAAAAVAPAVAPAAAPAVAVAVESSEAWVVEGLGLGDSSVVGEHAKIEGAQACSEKHRPLQSVPSPLRSRREAALRMGADTKGSAEDFEDEEEAEIAEAEGVVDATTCLEGGSSSSSSSS